MAETICFTEEDLQIDLADLMTGRGFITGKSGSGKSNTAGKIAEEILDKGYPLMVIDIEGEYYGLKEQYELLHVGADEECDLQVGPEHAQKIAELALEKSIPIYSESEKAYKQALKDLKKELEEEVSEDERY